MQARLHSSTQTSPRAYSKKPTILTNCVFRDRDRLPTALRPGGYVLDRHGCWCGSVGLAVRPWLRSITGARRHPRLVQAIGRGLCSPTGTHMRLRRQHGSARRPSSPNGCCQIAWQSSIARCGRPRKTLRTSPERPTSTTARWRCDATLKAPLDREAIAVGLLAGGWLRTACQPRPLALLAVLVAATAILAAIGFSAPTRSANTPITGTITSGSTVQHLRLDPSPPPKRSFVARCGTAWWIALEAAVFRSSDETLSSAGRHVQTVVRFFGPVLLWVGSVVGAWPRQAIGGSSHRVVRR
jgi:hypothetical protein